MSWVGASGAWTTASNWSTDTLPQPGDTVIINKSGSIQVTLTGNASINSISVTGDTLTLSSGTLSVAASSSINAGGTLTLTNATLTLASGAGLTNSGSITVNPLSALDVGGAFSQTSTGDLTLPSGTLTSGVGTNLLDNGGFESPSADGSTTTYPSGWGPWGTSYVDTQFAHGGAQSIVQSGSNSGVNQSFSVTPGVSYTLTAYAMTPSTAKLTGSEEGILNLIFDNSSGGEISSDGITVLTANSATGGPIAGSVGNQGWNFFTTTGTAPSGAVSAYIALQVGPYSGIAGTAGGDVYWDDAEFGATATSSAVVNAAGVSNSGTITVGAGDTINSSATFSQSSTGTLITDLGGSPSSLLFGSVDATGAATLGGTLKAVLVNGYSPSVSDGFNILTYSTSTGSFATTTLPSGSSYAFQSAINPQYVGISALPPTTSTTVNINSDINPASTNILGVNLAYWDDQLTTSETASMLDAAGLDMFRFPGGSASDDYHFNSSSNDGDSSANTIPQFAEVVDSVGGQAIITTDYGSGSPQEAEAELAYLVGSPSDTTVIGDGQEWSDSLGEWQTVNWQTVGYWAGLRAASPLQTNDGYNFLRVDHPAAFTGMTYWEIGNEQYGTWEIDHYSPTGVGGNATTGGYNYPAAYAQFAASFSAFAKADPLLPAILVGINSGDPTGASDNNWTQNVLADGFADGFVPGFISDHSYMYGPGDENDSILLNDTVSNPSSTLDWSTRYADYENLLKETVGAANAAGVHIMATEYNSNYGTPGKQMVSLVNGLFVADSIGSLLDSGYTGGLFWDLRNGWGTGGNNSPTLYGWRQGGDEGILGDPNLYDPPDTGAYIPYPNYFAFDLAQHIDQSGGEVVTASSNYNELAVYTVLEANGHLDLLVINKNPDASINEQFNLTGFTPNGQAQFWQYGEPEDYAQSQSSTGAASLDNFSTDLTFNGDSFSYAFPAYSMTVIDLTPMLSVATAAAANPNPVVGSLSTALSALGSENGTGNGLTYAWSATGPAPVTYTGATNGTNAAKNITANFSQVGTYNFTVTITDTGGQTVNSAVQVVVLPAFASQTGSTVTITLNNLAPIAVATSSGNVTVTEDGYQYTFSGVSAITVNGSATSDVLNFNGPVSMPFTFTNAASSTVNVNSGTLTLASNMGGTVVIGNLSVTNGASAALTPATTNSPTTLVLSALSIGSTGWLDIANNQVLINYGSGPDPIDTIFAWIASGYADGSWNGPGIISTTAQTNANYGLGYADAADANNPANLPSGQIKIMYTLLGDANLDGDVNGGDFTIMAANFNQSVTAGWDRGDFNYDGDVNGADFTLLSSNFNQSAQIAAVTTNAPAAAVTPVSTSSISTTSNSTDADSSDVVSTVLHKHVKQKKTHHNS